MIARRTLLVLLNNAVGALLGFVLLHLIDSYVGADVWGRWLFAVVLIGFPLFLTGLGFTTAHVKRLSSGADEGHANGTFLAIRVALTFSFVLITLAGIAMYKRYSPESFVEVSDRLIWLALAHAAVQSLRQFFDFTFQGHRLVATAESVLFVETFIQTVFVGAVALALGHANGYSVPLNGLAEATGRLIGIDAIEGRPTAADLELAAFYLGLGYFLSRAASLVYAAGAFVVQRHPLAAPTRTDLRFYVRFALPLALIGFTGPLVMFFDRALLGYFFSNDAVALFTTAFLLLGPMLVIAMAVYGILFPTLSALEEHKRGDSHESLRDTERYLGMTLVPQLMLAVVFARDAIHMTARDQPAFEAVIVPLQVMAFGFFINAFATTPRTVVLGFGKPSTLARINILHAVVLCVLNLIFIPPSILGFPLLGWGVLGAAVATTLTHLVTYPILRHVSRRWYPGPLVSIALLRQLAAGLLAGALLWWLRGFYDAHAIERLLELAAVGALGIALYLVALFLLGGLRRSDLHLFSDMFHPGKFASYVRRDMRGRR